MVHWPCQRAIQPVSLIVTDSKFDFLSSIIYTPGPRYVYLISKQSDTCVTYYPVTLPQQFQHPLPILASQIRHQSVVVQYPLRVLSLQFVQVPCVQCLRNLCTPSLSTASPLGSLGYHCGRCASSYFHATAQAITTRRESQASSMQLQIVSKYFNCRLVESQIWVLQKPGQTVTAKV